MKRSMALRTVIVLSGSVSACAHEGVVAPNHPLTSPARPAYSLSAPVSDAVMGGLSRVAQAVVAGLRDSTTRINVSRAMHAAPYGTIAGLDLQACGSDAVVAALLSSAEHYGAGSAKDLCAFLAKQPGAILYMDPGRLRRWNGTTIPVVTARATMTSPLPATIQVYRSPDRLMTMPTDGSMVGPVLYVLPLAHPSRLTHAGPATVILHSVSPAP